jgi:hypothetical protein
LENERFVLLLVGALSWLVLVWRNAQKAPLDANACGLLFFAQLLVTSDAPSVRLKSEGGEGGGGEGIASAERDLIIKIAFAAGRGAAWPPCTCSPRSWGPGVEGRPSRPRRLRCRLLRRRRSSSRQRCRRSRTSTTTSRQR